jgi:uncharacterized protein (TIGR02001 family)
VTARAVQRGTRARGLATSLPRSGAFRALLFAAALAIDSPAMAQTGAAFSIFNDFRFRGFSLSDGRPVGVIDLSYDAPNGLYGAISGSLVATRGESVQPLGIELNAGYAKRLRSGLTIDMGATHSAYSEYSSRGSAYSYSEVYAGVAGKYLSGRLSVSPDYLHRDAWTLYGELNGTVPVVSKLRFTGHVGLLVPLNYHSSEGNYRHEFDWRIGLEQYFGRLSIHADWAGARPGDNRYPPASRDRSGIVFGITYAF